MLCSSGCMNPPMLNAGMLPGRLKAIGPKAKRKAGINNRPIVQKIYYAWTELIAQ